MAISVIGGATSSAGVTDDGGVVVKSTSKQSAAVHLPLDAALVAGSYLLKITGTGTLFVNTYTGTTLGGKLATINSNAQKSITLVIPSGITGLYFSGSYSGPIVFQTVASAANAVIATKTFVEKSRYSEYTSPAKNIQFIEGTNLGIKWVAGNNIQTIDLTTGAVIRTSTEGFFLPNTGTTSSAGGWTRVLKNGDTLVFGQGYNGSASLNFWRSLDNGVTWSSFASASAPFNAPYAETLKFINGRYYALIAGDGTGSSSSNGYFYSNNGSTWTYGVISGASNSYTEMAYGNGIYVAAVAGGYAYFGNSTTVYWTSTDGLSWTSRTSPIANRTTLALFYKDNFFWMHLDNDTVYRSSDGLNWSSFSIGYSPQGKRGIYQNAGNQTYVQESYSVGDNGYWFVTSNYELVYVPFVNTVSNKVAYQTKSRTPFDSTYGAIMIYRLANGKYITTSHNSSLNTALYYFNNLSTTWDMTLSSVSGMPVSMPGYKVFMSKKFNRYYYADVAGTGLWYSNVGTPTNWTKVSNVTLSGAQYNDRIFETENYLSVLASPTLIYRTSDGVNWSSVTIASDASIEASVPGLAFAVNGRTIIARTTKAGEYLAVSSDEGVTWNVVCVNQSGSSFATGGNLYVNSTSEGFIATQGNIYYISKDGLIWEKMPSVPNGTIEHISVANDTAFSLHTVSSPTRYMKTATSGLIATTTLTSPFGGTNKVTINQLGTGFILVGGSNYNGGLNTSACYTSPDGVTWTQYNLPQQGVWYGMIGGTTGDNTLLWDSTNKMFLELQENSTITLS